ncbi:MAG: hypothetical protein QXP38_08205 [Nitrososphaerota archaeon]
MAELMIATLLMVLFAAGLMRGVLEYNKFAMRSNMKNRAVQISRSIENYLEKELRDNLEPNVETWKKVKIACASDDPQPCFDLASIQSDNAEGFFYIGSPDFQNQIDHLSSRLKLYPSANGNTCECRGDKCPAALPQCVYTEQGIKFYVAVNVAKLVGVYQDVQELGKVAGIVIWYFEPFTKKLQKVTTLVVSQ